MFIVWFEDEGSAASQRELHMSAHLEFLTRNADRIKSAGPLMDPPSGLPKGGLWMVDCETEDTVWGLVKQDPFWPTGLRRNVVLYRWNRVFADGNRMAAREKAG